MSTKFLRKLPNEKWFSLEEIEGDPKGNKLYLNILVSKCVLERRYIFVGGVRKSQFYIKKAEAKKRVQKRRCLFCGRLFRPTHKYNFLCSKHGVIY